jgi:hypothetical protein
MAASIYKATVSCRMYDSACVRRYKAPASSTCMFHTHLPHPRSVVVRAQEDPGTSEVCKSIVIVICFCCEDVALLGPTMSNNLS